MNKLNKTFKAEQVLTADEMNQITSKIDEIIDNTTTTINGEPIISNGGNIVINPTIMDLKWTTDLATTKKLVPIELRKKGVKIAYTDASGVYHVEQYQLDAIDDTNWANNSNWKGCRTPMTAIFENAGAKFNDETGYYEMNGLIDIDEQEILNIYKTTYGQNVSNIYINRRDIRTNFMPNPYYNGESNFNMGTNLHNDGIKALALAPEGEIFGFCKISTHGVRLDKCERIIGIMGINSIVNNDTNTFVYKGKEFYMYFSNTNIGSIYFDKMPNLNYDSWHFLVHRSVKQTSKNCTIRVHNDIYNLLTGSATDEQYTATDHTKEEWMQIVTDAQAKLISFTTTG